LTYPRDNLAPSTAARCRSRQLRVNVRDRSRPSGSSRALGTCDRLALNVNHQTPTPPTDLYMGCKKRDWERLEVLEIPSGHDWLGYRFNALWTARD
jgi:hypothetical protein